MATDSWEIQDVWGLHVTHWRHVGGDRIAAYVEYDNSWDDDDGPNTFHWSVQDGSRAKVLDQGWIDGKNGFEAAKAAADAAAKRLFPEFSQ